MALAGSQAVTAYTELQAAHKDLVELEAIVPEGIPRLGLREIRGVDGSSYFGNQESITETAITAHRTTPPRLPAEGDESLGLGKV